MGIEGKLLVSRKNIVVSKDSIGIDKDLTKDRNLNTFKMHCKRRKSSARFPDRKARNPLYACHCIAGNDKKKMPSEPADRNSHCSISQHTCTQHVCQGGGGGGMEHHALLRPGQGIPQQESAICEGYAASVASCLECAVRLLDSSGGV